MPHYILDTYQIQLCVRVLYVQQNRGLQSLKMGLIGYYNTSPSNKPIFTVHGYNHAQYIHVTSWRHDVTLGKSADEINKVGNFWNCPNLRTTHSSSLKSVTQIVEVKIVDFWNCPNFWTIHWILLRFLQPIVFSYVVWKFKYEINRLINHYSALRQS